MFYSQIFANRRYNYMFRRCGNVGEHFELHPSAVNIVTNRARKTPNFI